MYRTPCSGERAFVTREPRPKRHRPLQMRGTSSEEVMLQRCKANNRTALLTVVLCPVAFALPTVININTLHHTATPTAPHRHAPEIINDQPTG